MLAVIEWAGWIQGPGSGLAERGDGEETQHGERSYLDQPGHGSRCRTHLSEAEKPDPNRKDIPSEGRKRETCSCGRNQAATGHDDQRSEAEGGNDLEQEQPTDRRDRPVAREVKVEVDPSGREDEPRSKKPPEKLPTMGHRVRLLHAAVFLLIASCSSSTCDACVWIITSARDPFIGLVRNPWQKGTCAW